MFKNSKFIKVDFENIPLNQDITIMDEKWAKEYETEWKRALKGKKSSQYSVGYVSRAAVRSIGENWRNYLGTSTPMTVSMRYLSFYRNPHL